MKAMRTARAMAIATLYGAATLIASPASADLDVAEVAALKEMRAGDMTKLVIHDEARARLETRFETAQGEAKAVADFAGKVVVLNFWATWCPPCRKEMPSLDRLQAAMGDDGFEVVAVSMDRASTEKIQDFFEAIPTEDGGVYKVENLAIYREPTLRIGTEAGVLGLPVTLVLDRQGRELARLQGDAAWDSPEAQDMLRAIIRSLDDTDA